MKKGALSRWFFPVTSIIGLLLILASCGGGTDSKKPKLLRNTPEFAYNEAKEAMSAIKIEKAISLTNDVMTRFPNSVQAQRARLLRIVLLTGLAHGYGDLADAYITGFEKGGKNAGQFRSTGFDFYRKKKNAALGFNDSCDYMIQNYSDKADYLLDCDFPSKEASMNRLIEEVKKGNLLNSEQLKIAEEQELREGVLVSLATYLGTENDRNKARKLLEEGSRPLDPAEFFVRSGRIFLEDQKLFGRKILNEIQYYRLFFQKAQECLNLAQKILKEKPNQEAQETADQLKVDLEMVEKKGKI
jgi:hypothetical protein